MDKLNMKTENITQENIEKIRALFPNAVTEVKKDGKVTLAVDFDVLKQELSESLIETGQERYQMTWPDKKKSVLLANSAISATLRPCKEESVDFDNTQNLYIEGDNLDVLKLLRETYLGKVKMIYIDPPYNTGNDFVYEDDFTMESGVWSEKSGDYDEQGNRLVKNLDSNGRFHTDWLNMIYPRLKIARDLLTDDGVIFISIDDNEQANLKKICDEVFGESNFICSLVRMIMEGGKSDSIGVAIEHELCLVYIKQELSGINQRIAGKQEHYNKRDQHFLERGYYYLKPLENGGLGYVASLDYSIIGPNGKEIYPGGMHGDNGYRWVWGQEKFLRALSLDMIEFVVSQKDSSKYKVYYKIYEKVDTDGVSCQKMLPFGSLYLEGFTNRQAINEIKKIFSDRVFSYPKPTSFIKELIKMGANKDSIILDFFSGSATTAHAVMQLNAEDGGKRKFIMVQLPEKCDEKSEAYKAGYKNICEIGKERIRRAGRKILESEELRVKSEVKKSEELSVKSGIGESGVGDNLHTPHSTLHTLDVGFRVLKLDSSNMQDVYYNPAAMAQSLLDTTIDNVKPDRTPMDLLFQVMLELGVQLSAKIEEKEVCGKKYFVVNGNEIIACFDDNINNDVITEIAKQQPLYAVFKDKSFATDSVGINNEQLFKTYSPITEVKVI